MASEQSYRLLVLPKSSQILAVLRLRLLSLTNSSFPPTATASDEFYLVRSLLNGTSRQHFPCLYLFCHQVNHLKIPGIAANPEATVREEGRWGGHCQGVLGQGGVGSSSIA